MDLTFIMDDIKKFVIFSDSKSALLLINKRGADNQYVCDMHRMLYALLTFMQKGRNLMVQFCLSNLLPIKQFVATSFNS